MSVSRDGDRRRVAGRRPRGPLSPHLNDADPGPASPHVEASHDREMQRKGSGKHLRTALARFTHVARVTIRPISRDTSILIVLGRGDMVPMRYDDGVASAIEDAVGHAVKLTSVSIDPLPPGAWILTGLVGGLDEDGDAQTGDRVSVAQAKKRASRSALRPRRMPQSSSIHSSDEGQQSSGREDGGSSSDTGDASDVWREFSQERGENGASDEESDGLGDSGWKSRHIKGSKWEDSEDEHLRMWVTKVGRPRWKAICRRFSWIPDHVTCI